MILLVLPEGGADVPETPDSPDVHRLRAASTQEVIDRVVAEPVDRVVIPCPPGDINPFALARALRRRHGPPVVLAGSLRPDTRFWAERNGCLMAEHVDEALGIRGCAP